MTEMQRNQMLVKAFKRYRSPHDVSRFCAPAPKDTPLTSLGPRGWVRTLRGGEQ